MPISWSRFFRLSPSRAVAVKSGSSHVALARFHLSLRGKIRLEEYRTAAIAEADQTVDRWSRAMGEALQALAAGSRFRGAIQWVLSGRHTLLKFVRYSSSEGIRAHGLLEFEAQRAIPCSLDEVTWDHAVVAETSGEIEAVLAAAKLKHAEAVMAGSSAAGFRVDRLLPASLALLRAFRFNYPELQERAWLVSVGAQSTCFIFIGGGRYFARAFDFGGAALTQTLAQALGFPWERAEEVKRRSELTPASEGKDATDAVVIAATSKFGDRLAFEMERTLAHYCERFEAPVPTTIFLVGGATGHARWPEMLANRFSCRVVRYDSLRNLEMPRSDVARQLTQRSLDAELLGAALAHLLPEIPVPNLLPMEFKERKRLRRLTQLGAAAIIVGIAALIPALAYWHVRAQRAGFHLTRVEQHLMPTRQLAARNSRNLGALEKARSELVELRRTVAKKNSWLRFMADLQQRLAQAEDVWLEQLQLKQPIADDPPAVLGPTIVLGGRLLDTENPRSKVSPESYQRVLNLLRLLAQSPFVSSVKDERFDNSQPGILRFYCTLVLASPDSL